MKRKNCTITLTVLLFLLSPATKGQSKFDSLSVTLKQIFVKDSLPGMSVILVDNKHIIYEQNFGFANVDENIKYNSSTVQNIGSVSKTFIAAAIMKAVELGYFNLETPINDVLPFKVVNANHSNAAITVRELCNHTSSIVDEPVSFPNTYIFKENLAPYNKSAYEVLQNLGYHQQIIDTTLAVFLKEYLTIGERYYSKNNFSTDAPGEASHYSNVASALAAYLIEIKSGMSYADFVKKYILKPLKMNNSGWYIDPKKLNHYARPYFNTSASFPFYQCITYPDGGLRTTTQDLSKYVMAMINGYNGDEKLLSKTSYQTMFTPQFIKEHPPKGISLAYRNKGIFWNLYNNGSIGHDGDDPGVSSFLFFNPKTGRGGIFLCNKYLADKSEIANLLMSAAGSDLSN